jgi:hypothetical protein
MDFKLPPIPEFPTPPEAKELPAAAIDPANQAQPQPDMEPSADYGSGDNDTVQNGSDYDNSGANSYEEPENFAAAEEDSLQSVDFPSDAMISEDVDGLPEFDDETEISAGDMPDDGEIETKKSPEPVCTRGEEVKDTFKNEEKSTNPQVNLLANLIRWIAKARQEIGAAQLPVFLDAYSTTGNLSSEMREVIMHLADAAAESSGENAGDERNQAANDQLTLCMDINSFSGQLPEEIKVKVKKLTELTIRRALNSGKADIWSQLLLELHGILTEGGFSLHPLSLENRKGLDQLIKKTQDMEGESENQSDLEEDDSEDDMEDSKDNGRKLRPARLRLVMPVDNGEDQELDLGDLFIETDVKKIDRGCGNSAINGRNHNGHNGHKKIAQSKG